MKYVFSGGSPSLWFYTLHFGNLKVPFCILFYEYLNPILLPRLCITENTIPFLLILPFWFPSLSLRFLGSLHKGPELWISAFNVVNGLTESFNGTW